MKNREDSFNLNEISKYRPHLFGIAIIMVVFHHLTYKYDSGLVGKAYMFLRVTGAMGVDIFLFLSGLGCYYSFSKNESISEFYSRRFKRILPAYLIVALIAYFITDIILDKTGILTYLADVSLISFWINGGSDWYIAASIFLYLLFPLLYKYTTQIKHGPGVLLVAWLVIVITVYSANRDYFNATSRLWARVPVFIFGIIIAPKVKNGIIIKNWSRKLAIVIVVNIVSLLIEASLALKGSEYAYSFTARLLYCPLAISASIILVYVLSRVKMQKCKKALAWGGGITLEIYMLNQRLIGLSTFLGVKLVSNNDLAILFWNVVGVIVTLLTSYWLHKAIDSTRKRLAIL